jgi:hypothetical protein
MKSLFLQCPHVIAPGPTCRCLLPTRRPCQARTATWLQARLIRPDWLGDRPLHSLALHRLLPDTLSLNTATTSVRSLTPSQRCPTPCPSSPVATPQSPVPELVEAVASLVVAKSSHAATAPSRSQQCYRPQHHRELTGASPLHPPFSRRRGHPE